MPSSPWTASSTAQYDRQTRRPTRCRPSSRPPSSVSSATTASEMNLGLIWHSDFCNQYRILLCRSFSSLELTANSTATATARLCRCPTTLASAYQALGQNVDSSASASVWPAQPPAVTSNQLSEYLSFRLFASSLSIPWFQILKHTCSRGYNLIVMGFQKLSLFAKKTKHAVLQKFIS